MRGVATLFAAWEDFASQQRDFMAHAMIEVIGAINAALGNGLACAEEVFLRFVHWPGQQRHGAGSAGIAALMTVTIPVCSTGSQVREAVTLRDGKHASNRREHRRFHGRRMDT